MLELSIAVNWISCDYLLGDTSILRFILVLRMTLSSHRLSTYFIGENSVLFYTLVECALSQSPTSGVLHTCGLNQTRLISPLDNSNYLS